MAQRDAAAESLLTVVIALGSNLLIALAKSAAAALTGSASMLAEAAHSWADTGNEVLLVFAERRARRPRDAAHPLGFGKDAYIWSMFAAFGIFTVGAVVSVQHGVTELLNPEPATDFWVAYLVLGVSFVLEGHSFLRALRQSRVAARETGKGTIEQVVDTSNPTLRAVFAEDAAALIGLVIAFVGILLHELTGSAFWDAMGSILVGVVLGVVAVVLIVRNRAFLLGQAVDESTRQRVLRDLLASDEIERVTYLHLEFLGPREVLLVASVDLAGDAVESDVALRLRAIERRAEAVPEIARAVLGLSTPDEPALVPAPVAETEPTTDVSGA